MCSPICNGKAFTSSINNILLSHTIYPIIVNS